MKISIDRTRCAGHARCAAVAPEIYPLDDDGYIAVDEVTPSDEQEARACPERIITVDE